MSDELVRRALYRNRQQRTQGSDQAESLTRRHFAVVSKNSDAVYERLVNESFARLGVWPLWVAKEYKDLPARLEKLREALETSS
jgi:hypothetical protein